ncbi:translational GTPase TypA [Candidatus Uhrbacteria bacterium CG_4_9_14_0_2_um_filter_41_50]|uniref:Large ribosomal subunit assembly factor BipA n=1 Tax=Candidatus Uhrbacteria bacterium CG_4_9_14_0_2_um_filter_41_50 TaxID=1975031 RepID=A0A2M8ENA8_9BACT|nr:MAG: translational GTPase TypA [Candidatus Uhrbacteria bacterium CG_4_10_14_3_um_filter_41_21]PIZ54479.1 MAG: translational GTPase TypA [Candidatus Uhrbacteria bacterium CG_4_10_14_0_2_um_filter_41_21]PJB84829.1 MAG: translational GTPase TypA [Candidatus Uhrbacteria bacterium CG_4_9_14_0_8_um_filter_41_16]PJC24214.1 MAG: translational GTPase TypA [Candidatus Uhrbacteria bacterium CG_4_9_14_0_2_um_filter_41_50]PJE75214.1 MAG: translational GTPase TypA [Candidatus Uhrbacteria bacterium CG10_bi
MEFRNIAIIAHVDHGKTTLVDAMLQQSGVFTEREVIEERVMDSNDQEKERGITIYAKNASIQVGDVKVNIVDTPGHADFGSEVERVLRMVDSVLLLVDAYEGPMPQTKFVLRKALELGLRPIVVINKIDKPTARPDEVLNMIFDLFTQLGATDEQLDFKYIYTNAKKGIAILDPKDTGENLQPLFDLIISTVPSAASDSLAPVRFQPVNLMYDKFVGRMGTGRINEGTLKVGMTVTVIKLDGTREKHKISKILTSQGLKKVEVESAVAGDIVSIAGIPNINVGETVAEDAKAEALDAIDIDKPTLTMDFLVNNSPFAGREGKYVTSRQIRERLERELETNVGLQIEFPENSDVYKVSGRGEMHLAVLIETMRREGYEFQVSQPQAIIREVDGELQEPYESVVIDVPDDSAGTVIEALGKRKGEMVNMISLNGSTRLEYSIPTRGLLGYRTDFMTSTKGEGTLSHIFSHMGSHKGEITRRQTGSMISGFTGKTLAFALNNLQQRGALFVGPGVEVYEGMVVGASSKDTMVVNPIKGKQLTNMRSSGADEATSLTPPLDMNLERSLEYIADDEYVEVTPESIRIRKKYLTDNDRKRAAR